MKILLAQINPTIADLAGNYAKILNFIELGRQHGYDCVVFPEMALSGYPPEDFLLLPHFITAVEEYIPKIAAATQGIGVIVGTVRRNLAKQEKPLFNTAALFFDAKLLGFQDKTLLPTYDVFDERRYFEPAKSNQPWKIGTFTIGVTICEDIWQHSGNVKQTDYAEDPIADLKKQSLDCLVNLSASPYHLGKITDRIEVCKKAAVALSTPLLLCNQVGGNDSLIFDGYSLAVDSDGHLSALAAGFREEPLFVDTDKLKTIQLHEDPLETLYEALVLGIRDYFHKSGFKKACLGLSGGIDSALVACLAAEALGPENVLAVAMPSRFSSKGSLEDASALAKRLKLPLRVIPIENPHQSYLDLLTPYFEGRGPDTTEENLQARIRGMILMALSNKLKLIVLSTGNKSELAMGYSTLYGDMCGGLAVISDLTKEQVYALSRWINRDQELIPKNTLEKPPSAELKPGQKDSDSLPEYPIVDAVLKAYIEFGESPEEISTKHHIPLPTVIDLIRRIHANEYKRRQSPPGLRISEKAFSIGRRFPIVQKMTY